ncbi:MAG TPA: hypothetical protein PLO23_11550, partial [Alphaproteobacteria bacterium]|nr:hypothetical protein [Alphaproteobacteria bacterium]
MKDFAARIRFFENRSAEYFRVFEQRKRRKALFAAQKTINDDVCQIGTVFALIPAEGKNAMTTITPHKFPALRSPTAHMAFISPKPVRPRQPAWVTGTFFLIAIMFSMCFAAIAHAKTSRIKDIVEIESVRDNQLIGY